MKIHIENKQKRIEIDKNELTKKARRLLKDLGCSPTAILSIALVNADEMAELNHRYRGKSGPTNVLSFSQSEGNTPTVQPDLLGDVVICSDRVVQDAESLGYSHEEMITYLLVHGILHLRGYSHDHPEDAASMETEVEKIFEKFYPASSEH